jgi:hypothetical protein
MKAGTHFFSMGDCLISISVIGAIGHENYIVRGLYDL